MRILPLGDTALLIDLGPIPDELTARAIRDLDSALGVAPLAGVTGRVPAFTTLAVHYDASLAGQEDRIEAWIRERSAASRHHREETPSRVLEIPVCYGGAFGPDLEEVARLLELTPAKVESLHADAEYEVRVVGFAPGFPYMAGLPESLRLPRHPTPRVRVAAGSVAIAGSRTGIYPLESPGGWRVIGRTPLSLFRPMENPPVLLQRGDKVRFQSISAEQFADWPVSDAVLPEASTAPASPGLRIIRPGALTTLQDLGRPGFQAHGVPPGGAMDRFSARLANLLVGNPEDAALLEFTMRGPVLHAEQAAVVALTGSRVAGCPWGRPFRLKAGETWEMEPLLDGARSYLAVAGGGVAVAPVLGSRSTYLRSGLPGWAGSALRPGDRVPLHREADRAAMAGSPPWFVPSGSPAPDGLPRTLRIVRGPQADWFSDEAWETLLVSEYRLGAKSDRMGLRFEGSPLRLIAERELISSAVVQGAMQVPPDGRPIVLGPDRQTLGGYPVIACVIAADFAHLAQIRPHVAVRFALIGIVEARRLRRSAEQTFGWLRAGLEGKRS